MFRSLILSACLVGVVLGLAMTAMQAASVTPILLSAEQYEVSDAGADMAHDHASGGHDHHHDEQAWAPADGGERLFYTTLSNIGAGIGFAAILLVLMNQLHARGRLTLAADRGLMVGGLCWLAVFLAPALGLPPEIPGASAAALESRQWWWFATVMMVAGGLTLLCLAQGGWRLLGLPLLLLPYSWVPTHDGPVFAHPDPGAVLALTQLHREFIWATGLSNLAFWLLAGLLCALVLKRLTTNTWPVVHDAST